MHAGCSTPTTRAGNGPGIPGLLVAARLWETVEAARAAYLRTSRRRIFTTTFYSRRPKSGGPEPEKLPGTGAPGAGERAIRAATPPWDRRAKRATRESRR